MIGTADDLRREADAMDRLAVVLSYGIDKKRLRDKAQEYRDRASSLDRDRRNPRIHEIGRDAR
jgi:hypothetical protein